MSNKSLQLEELEVLQNIFLDDEIQIIEKDYEKKIKLIFWVYPLLPKEYSIKYKDTLEDNDFSYVKISYLPPIEFFVKLPFNYPSECPPTFSIYCRWLSKEDTMKLNSQLDQIWCQNENSEVVYAWTDFLKNEALKYLGYEEELDMTLLNNYHLKCKKNKEVEYQDKQGSTEQGAPNRGDHVYSYELQSILENEKESYRERVYSGFASLTNKVKKITNWGMSSNSSNSSKSQSKAEQESGLHSSYDRRNFYTSNLKTSPVKLVISYNAERESIEFERKLILCVICFTDVYGKDCFSFDTCNHAYCKACISKYFTTKINDGIHPIKCPDSECTTLATVTQVKDLVSKELFMKYDDILVQAALDSMGPIIYCPRTTCQYPAAKDKDGTLGICPYCQYAFCIYCRMGYHGIEPCRVNHADRKKFVENYVSGSKEQKEVWDSRYGKSQITTMVNDTLAENWIEENCKNCPKCNVSIEKSEGCNKMICWKCNTYFCWLCSHELDRATPYAHFNDPNSPCSNKLFFLTPLGDDEVDDDYNSDDEQWRDWDWI